MTEYEVIDALSSLREEAGGHVMNFVSVMFGYIVAAYLVGPKLTRFQVSTITLVYVAWAPGPILAAVEAVTTIRNIYERYGDTVTVDLMNTPITLNAPEIIAVSTAISLIASVWFMFQIRSKAVSVEQSAT